MNEWTKNPTSQPVHHKVLVIMLSEKCVWAGISPLNLTGSFFGGGRHYVSIANTHIASRAASKFVEAMEFLKLKDILIPHGKKWLELGAAPGGITYELAQRKNEVWAIDKSELSPEILKNPLVHFYRMDAREFKENIKFDFIFCDLNGPSHLSAEICSEKAEILNKNGLIIHTFKIHSIPSFEEDLKSIVTLFKNKDCFLIEAKHLYNNKQEITLFFKRQ